jgi:hypothetical protein
LGVPHHFRVCDGVNRPPTEVLGKVRVKRVRTAILVTINQPDQVDREFPANIIQRDKAIPVGALFPVFPSRDPLDYGAWLLNVSGCEFEDQLFSGRLLRRNLLG